MIAFFHGFGLTFYFPVVWVPFFLLGYLISDKIKRPVTRWIWLGFLTLGLIACDVFFLTRHYDKGSYLILMVVAWCFMQMLLGQGFCALVNAIRLALRKDDKEESP